MTQFTRRGFLAALAAALFTWPWKTKKQKLWDSKTPAEILQDINRVIGTLPSIPDELILSAGHQFLVIDLQHSCPVQPHESLTSIVYPRDLPFTTGDGWYAYGPTVEFDYGAKA